MNIAATNKGLILFLACMAQFMVVLDIAIVNVALPAIQQDLGLRQSTLQWIVIAYGFVARVLTGPTLSPLGQLITRVVTPLLGVAPRPVPGPPKRFAQGIGAVLSVTAAVLAFGFHLPVAAYAVLGVLAAAAALEAVFAVCLGCAIFARLMRLGVIPKAVCRECNDIRSRSQTAARGA